MGQSRLKGAMGGMDRPVFPEGSSLPRARAGEQHMVLEVTRLISSPSFSLPSAQP